MLVEINLMPQKERKNFTILFILLAAFFLALVTGIFLYWQGKSLDGDLAMLENQIVTTKQLVKIEQEKGVGNSASKSIAELQSAVNWVSEARIKTVPIIQQVTSLLPERGFIQTISYDETGNISLIVQFDTSRESAYYLKNLLNSEWFSEVKLSSVSTSKLETASIGEQSTSKISGDNTEEDAVHTGNLETEGIIPRYIGHYELKLNTEFIQSQESVQESVASNEGG